MESKQNAGWTWLVLLIAGVVAMIFGLAWFFTPTIIDAGTDSIIMEWPNWRGVPFIGLAVALWIVAALVQSRGRKQRTKSRGV